MNRRKYRNRLVFKYIISLITLLLVMVISSCNSKNEVKNEPVFYTAIDKSDTAHLSISSTELHFKGNYEIWYGSRKIKDSGDVSGEIYGDTLIGTYNYMTYGGAWKRIPIAFLKRDKKLLLGTGEYGGYMGFVYFNPDVPLDFSNSKFIFEKTIDSLVTP